MIVDSSVLVAIIDLEPDAERYREAMLGSATPVRIAAPTYVEASIVADRRGRGRRLDGLLRSALIQVVDFDAEMARVAREAHRAYGRGSGHPARLNLGDCFSYALATVSGEPLLYKGDDFAHTDVRSALDAAAS